MKIQTSCEIKKFSSLSLRCATMSTLSPGKWEICGFSDNLQKSKSIIQFIYERTALSLVVYFCGIRSTLGSIHRSITFVEWLMKIKNLSNFCHILGDRTHIFVLRIGSSKEKSTKVKFLLFLGGDSEISERFKKMRMKQRRERKLKSFIP